MGTDNALKDAIYNAAKILKGYAQALPQHLALFDRLERGELDDQKEQWRPSVEAAIEDVTEAVRVANGYPHKNFASEFWQSQEGQQISRVYEWLYGTEYIRLAEAGAILFDLDSPDDYLREGNLRVHMNHLLFPAGRNKTPRLRLYWLTGDRNPMRVRRPEVLAIKPTIKRRADIVSNKLQRQREALRMATDPVNRYTERDIAAHFGVSLTQIQRDIKDAREAAQR